jgi:TolA-binding protein
MAHQNELYARKQAYLGPQHPSRTLGEAKKLADISLWQFGNELDSEDKANLLEIKEELVASEAERLWEMGYKYYDLKKRHYGSARIQYNKLIAEYPQTEYAEKARQRLEKINGLPDTPSIIRMPTNPFKTE